MSKRAKTKSVRGPPRGARGSVSVAAAGVMVAIVVLALAASDVARVLTAVSHAQIAADAAALAAAQEMVLTTGDGSPEHAAAEFASRNGAEIVSCSCAAEAGAAVVEVRVAVGRLLLFGSGRTVNARARAVVDRPGPG